MRHIKQAWRLLDEYFEEAIMVFLLAIIGIVIMTQVIMRYFLHSALSWPEEFARYCFIYTAFLSFGYCIRNNRLLKVDVILTMFSDKIQRIVEYVNQYITLALFSYFFYFSIDVVQSAYRSGTVSTALGLPIYLLNFSLTLGFGISILRLIQRIIILTNEFRKGGKET